MLVPGGFNTEPAPNGDIFMYPEGDRSVPPSGRMPKGGFYFDAIVRQGPIDENRLDPQDNLEEFGPVSDADLEHFAAESERLYRESDRAILANFGGTAFGDIALVPAPWLKHPKGIRDVEEWYVSTAARFDYVYEVFQRQCEIALANLAKIRDAVGDRVSVVMVTGTDFGTQTGLFISPGSYRSCISRSTAASTTGSTSTPRGRRSSTPAARWSPCCPTSSRRVSTSSIRCSVRPPGWMPAY